MPQVLPGHDFALPAFNPRPANAPAARPHLLDQRILSVYIDQERAKWGHWSAPALQVTVVAKDMSELILLKLLLQRKLKHSRVRRIGNVVCATGDHVACARVLALLGPEAGRSTVPRRRRGAPRLPERMRAHVSVSTAC